MVLSPKDLCTGQVVAAVRLKMSDSFEYFTASVYNPANVTLRVFPWGELIEVVSKF